MLCMVILKTKKQGGSQRPALLEGAAYFAPKDEIANIAVFVADVIDAIQKNKNPWIRFMERLGGFYDRRFVGTNWREKELEYLDKRKGGWL